jgi:hypothetical protein
VRVEREHARGRLALEQHVEEDALLLLERARERDVGVERLEDRLDDLLGAECLDVGLADELCDASLHDGERYQHEQYLSCP